jgi:hypothetical protein
MLDKRSAKTCSVSPASFPPFPIIFLVILLAAYASRAASESAPDIVIPVPEAPDVSRRENLMENGDFEDGKEVPLKGWDAYEAGYSVREGEGRSGSRCVTCEGASPAERRGAVARLTLDQKRPVPVYVEGWSKAENVSGAPDADYSIYVDCIYDDGTPLWGTNAPFSTGTHDWQKVSFFVTPAKPIKSLSLNLLFRSHSGKVWFDDVGLAQLASRAGTSFDGVPTLEPDRAPSPPPVEAIVMSADGLEIGFDRSGSTVALCEVSSRFMKFAGTPAGFFVRDAAEQSAFFSFRGEVKSEGPTRVVLSGRAESLSLRLNVTIQGHEKCVGVYGTVSDVTWSDCSVSLYFALPVGGARWTWWDDATSPRDTTKGGDFRNVAPVGAGSNGTMSRYPLSVLCDTENRLGLSLAVPMHEPRLYRIAYDADRGILYIVYDFGLCPAVEAFPGKASFSFIIYSFDPTWGFRAALQKYYDIYPQFFTKRLDKEGLWMAFHRISSVQNFEDFGFAFKEGTDETKFDDDHGILTFRYTEPQSYWQRMPKGVERTYDGCVDFLKRTAAAGNRNALAAVSSGIYDGDGKYRLTVENAPWCDGCVFALNPSPSLRAEVTKARLNYDTADADRRYGAISDGILDGEYLDSLEGWSDLCNFRREHFISANTPLTFDTSTKKPCILNVFSIYEFAKYISEDVHRRDKLMMANAVPLRFGFFCHLFDTCGIEINWKRGGRFSPDDEWLMNYRRAMMFQKPYLFLMNTSFGTWTYSDTEKYMRRCMFYAFYPSFFSADASSNHYFSQPALYNRDRPLFKKYVPIIRALGKAGWQPITHARTSDGEIRVERYGVGKDGTVYLTVLNASGETKTVKVEVDLAAIGLAGRAPSAEGLSSDRRVQLVRKGNVALITLELSPGDGEVIRLGQRADTSSVAFFRQNV